MSDRPDRYQSLRQVFLFRSGGSSGEPTPVEVEWVWEHRGRPVFKFRGVDSMSDAELLRGAEVRIPAEERLELPPGEFYHSDLIGCEVVERQTGNVLGTVRELQEFGGPGLLAVQGPEGELLVPFARSICVDIDITGRRIMVDLPEGLKEL